MSAWVEGLLGAVMGGAQEYGNVLKEEETAKRKEEEERRREERAFSLAERKAEAEQKRKQALEEQERARVAKMMGPQTRITPGASPMEPEGIVQSQIPLEERLKTGAEQAFASGDTKTAKNFLDQYQTLKEIERKTAEELRKQEEFGREKPEKPTGKVAEIKFIAESTYSGPMGEDGKPEPAAFSKHLAGIAKEYQRKETYIRPEREAGPKPLSEKDRDIAQGRIGKLIEGVAVSQPLGAKTPQKDPVKQDIYNSLFLQVKNEFTQKDADKDPDAVYKVDLNELKSELTSRFSQIERRSREIAGRKFDDFRGSKTTPGDPNAITDPVLKEFAKDKKLSKETFVNEAAPKFLQEAAAGGKSESNTKTVTFQGKQYTVRKAPDGNWYREEGGKYYRWSE